MKLKDIYDEWRKRTLPPSVNDIDWRMNELRLRLQQIQRQLDSRIASPDCSAESQKAILEFFRLLRPHRVDGYSKIRLGSPNDGGYVQIDDPSRISLALSLGISNDDNWDFALAKLGIPVEQFDHTIEAAPTQHPLLAFHKKKVTPLPSADSVTLPEIIKRGSANSDAHLILKIDIEGDEWAVIDSTPDECFEYVSQIICEFHGLSQLTEAGFYRLARRVLEKLDRRFSVFHVHGNNCSPLVNLSNVVIPNVLEVSFANRAMYAVSESDELYPTDLDAPCDANYPDYYLGSFRF
ncbi:MAG: hypothetical protein ACR652_23905 [Methylocystis sp.]|uniref:hypothetical protein n=1 Tax=Methylocystis sp. TaxID=1911079 RepID=UPI003DA3D0DA